MGGSGTGVKSGEGRIFFSFYFLNFLFQIPEFLTVGFRRDKYGKCSTRRGLRVGKKKHGISPRIQVKIQKNHSF